MSNLGAISFVGHHQHFKFLHIVNQNFLEAARHHVSCYRVASITDVGHLVHTLELTPNSVVNTLPFE